MSLWIVIFHVKLPSFFSNHFTCIYFVYSKTIITGKAKLNFLENHIEKSAPTIVAQWSHGLHFRFISAQAFLGTQISNLPETEGGRSRTNSSLLLPKLSTPVNTLDSKIELTPNSINSWYISMHRYRSRPYSHTIFVAYISVFCDLPRTTITHVDTYSAVKVKTLAKCFAL